MKYFKVITTIMFFLLFYSCTSEPIQKTDSRIEKMHQGKSEETLESYQEYINSNYQVFAMPLPKTLDFAGEIVPLENVFVRDNLDREVLVNTYWHSNTFLFQKRANRWFPIIEKILKENNMPDDLKYIALIESGLDDVRSPAGASGFWQFMSATASGYGLEINEFVDERYHLEKATVAACKYLKIAHDQFGSWSLAAASYNMGKGGLNSQLSKQKVDSYYDLYLNTETSRYVYRILAAKLILSNSENFGFSIRNKELYQPYRTYSVFVDSSISDLPQFAIDNGTNYATMRHLNPWLRGYELPINSEKKYEIKLPKGDFHIEEEPNNFEEEEELEEEIQKDSSHFLMKKDTHSESNKNYQTKIKDSTKLGSTTIIPTNNKQ